MKFTNFKLIYTTNAQMYGISNKVFNATVDVETGMFWWKKTTTKQIRRNYGSQWFFVDTGHFISDFNDDIEAMARAWTAETGEAT